MLFLKKAPFPKPYPEKQIICVIGLKKWCSDSLHLVLPLYISHITNFQYIIC